MGIRDFQDYIESNCQTACKSVDLLKIGRLFQTRRRGKNSGLGHLRLIVDAESCLDRLYGGFYSDWACGGQWNRMTHFMNTLIAKCQSANMELVVFFNGAAETERLSEWAEQMHADKKKVASVLKHIHHKATPPPKVWWLAPVCLRTCLRMALRQMGVAVACSMDDHHQEVIAYCRENNFHGLLAQDADYAIFDPPRYFSSHHLKMTYKDTLETKEYMMDEVAQTMDLNPKRNCVLAALLGNHILTEEDLKEFFDTICTPHTNRNTADVIKAVVEFVRAFPTCDDLDEIGKVVFKQNQSNRESKLLHFKQSVQYYINGTKDGFLKYRPKVQASTPVRQPGSYPVKQEVTKGKVRTKVEEKTLEKEINQEKEEVKEIAKELNPLVNEVEKVMVNGQDNKVELKKENAEAEDPIEKEEEEEEELKDLGADSVYTEAESGYANMNLEGKPAAPEIVIDPPSNAHLELDLELATEVATLTLKEEAVDEEVEENNSSKEMVIPASAETTPAPESEGELDVKQDSVKLSSMSSSSSNSSFSPTTRLSPDNSSTPKGGSAHPKGKGAVGRQNGEQKLPQVPPEIMRIASERHQKGLMSPWIYQVLSQGEIKIGVSLEDENSRDLPLAVELFRPIRQFVYSILFDLSRRRNAHPCKDSAKNDAVIKEWVLPRGSNTPRAEHVRARLLDWKVPTVRRLWLGQAIEDKNRRLRAFLSCMRSDSPRMLNTTYVPQHLLIMACVIRYMVSNKELRFLRRHELEAFLCAAVSPLLHDVETMQEMKLPMITSRGVQLAALFMRGVETAIFANDACGAPVPWSICCPWLFFDGKLFHFKLLKANNNTPLLDMCDGQMDQMMRVERLRGAILDGIPLDTLFAKPNLPLMQPPGYGGGPYYPGSNTMQFRPAGAPPGVMVPSGGPMSGQMGRGVGRGRGLLGRSPVDSRGGQLQIAGVVVGNWGPNVAQQTKSQGNVAPPHVTAVGPRRGMRGISPGGRNIIRGRGLQVSMPRFTSAGSRGSLRGNVGGVRGGGGGMRPKSRIRGPAGYSINPTRVTLEQRSKTMTGRGRGCTVESPSDCSVVSVSQLMRAQDMNAVKTQGNDRDFGQFMDAEPVKCAEVKVNLDKDDDLDVGDETTL